MIKLVSSWKKIKDINFYFADKFVNVWVREALEGDIKYLVRIYYFNKSYEFWPWRGNIISFKSLKLAKQYADNYLIKCEYILLSESQSNLL